MSAITTISEQIAVVFPAHPRTLKNLREFNLIPSGTCHWGSDADELQPVSGPGSATPGAPVIAGSGEIGARQSRTGLIITPPLSYLDFLKLEMYARLVMTDSGGIQEETTVLNVPCLTLRENTERPITTTQGTNVLVGTDPGRIVDEALRVLALDPELRRGAVGDAPHPGPGIDLWDGHTAERIVDVLVGRRSTPRQ